MYNIYVGIDLSKNSTGLYIVVYYYEDIVFQRFYIIKPDKLNKKEKQAEQDNFDRFEYILYESYPKSDTNYENEYNKALNCISIATKIKELIMKMRSMYPLATIHICQEGISYGSSNKTKSVFDLAGLNYIVRSYIINMNANIFLYIATPAEIKKFATDKGNANKNMMIEKFKEKFPDISLPKIDDISDAYFMASFLFKRLTLK